MWNAWNVFTGWVDIPLSEKGIEEALEAGQILKNTPIDVIFTTPLIRASMTAMLVMSQSALKKVPVILHPSEGKMEEWGKIFGEEARENSIPVHIAWQLNERMYGELQGLNKDKMREKFGKEQVHIWRRSFDTAPPQGESLQDTAKRSIPYFQKKVVPELELGKNVLISAHGNSLRSIMMHLDGLSKTEVVKLELSTGIPIVYHFENGQYKKIIPYAEAKDLS